MPRLAAASKPPFPITRMHSFFNLIPLSRSCCACILFLCTNFHPRESPPSNRGFVVSLFTCISQSMNNDIHSAGSTLGSAVKKFPDEPLLACQLLELEMQTSPPSPESFPEMAAKINALAEKFPRYPQVSWNASSQPCWSWEGREGSVAS